MVERFSCSRQQIGLVQDVDGDLVRFSDYASLQKELAERTKERDEARITSRGNWANQRENDALTIEMYEWKARAEAATSPSQATGDVVEALREIADLEGQAGAGGRAVSIAKAALISFASQVAPANPVRGVEQTWQKPGERVAQGAPADEQSGETSHVASPAQVTDAQIEHMVQQFLRWKLPEDFSPDGGIQFVKQTDYGHTFEPVGTNLFDYKQAKAMVRYMLEGSLGAIGAGGQAVAELHGPYGWLNGCRGLSEDSWTLESDPLENSAEYFAIPLYALVDPFKEIGKDFDGKPALHRPSPAPTAQGRGGAMMELMADLFREVKENPELASGLALREQGDV